MTKKVFVLFLFSMILTSALTSFMRTVYAVDVGTLANDFTLTDIDGNAFSLSGYRGKVVLLDFFATWCGPCRSEIPDLKALVELYGENLVIISISVDPNYDTVSRLKQFKTDYGMTWRIARDTAGVSDNYGIQYIPTLFIIDQEGYVRYKHVGLTEASILSNELDDLILPPDIDPPSISNVVYSPQNPQPNDAVTVSAKVLDTESGVKAATLLYTIGGDTWTSLPMGLSAGSNYTAIIPKQSDGTTVQFKVKAEDNVGNIVESSITSYTVHASAPAIPGFPIEASIIGIVMAVAALTLLKKKQSTQKPTT